MSSVTRWNEGDESLREMLLRVLRRESRHGASPAAARVLLFHCPCIIGGRYRPDGHYNSYTLPSSLQLAGPPGPALSDSVPNTADIQ